MSRQSQITRQCADAVLMVRPAAFGPNPQTAASNRFQVAGARADVALRAREEFDGAVDALRAAGVTVQVADDTPEPPKPDACFPNNWVSFHGDGTAVLYPMLAENRRAERRSELLEALPRAGFELRRVVDLSGWEARDEYLEGTGSLVLDRVQRVAYACPSPRTTAAALDDFAAQLGYRVVRFDARGPGGRPVYHTNVLLALGERYAVLCGDSLPDGEERRRVEREIADGGRELVTISVAQMHGFAGNLLGLQARDGRPLVAMSTTAWGCLEPAQRRALERHGEVVTAAIPTIERHGGGSLRCMLAELFLPRRPGLARC